MKKSSLLLLALVATACHNSKEDRKTASVVSERYIHKYGYDVSPEEWKNSNYPGQVVTTMRNGVTITSSYDSGILHGPSTYTYPHSQTVQTLQLFEHGSLIKKVEYSVKGTPLSEEIYLSPSHMKLTKWYPSGTPLSTEEFVDGVLTNAEYFSSLNEAEYHITNGSGTRVIREGNRVVTKETFEDGQCVRREGFHQNGTPHIIVSMYNGNLHGEKLVYAASGEPLSEENFSNGNLHGLCTYYQNGLRYLELEYKNGRKDGIERHYIDGELVAEETHWKGGVLHGQSTVYHDGMAKTEWYYNNEKVPQAKYDELTHRSQTIATLNEWSRPHSVD